MRGHDKIHKQRRSVPGFADPPAEPFPGYDAATAGMHAGYSGECLRGDVPASGFVLLRRRPALSSCRVCWTEIPCQKSLSTAGQQSGPAQAQEIITYAHKLCYTTFAPPGYEVQHAHRLRGMHVQQGLLFEEPYPRAQRVVDCVPGCAGWGYTIEAL